VTRVIAPLVLLVALLALLACGAPTAPASRPQTASYAALPAGKLLGMPQWPISQWGNAPFTTTLAAVAPREASPELAQAQRRNLPVLLGLTRAQMTTTGRAKGRFSLTNALANLDRLAKRITPDTLAKYAPWIAAWYLMDEPFCDPCWDGRGATYQEALTFAKAFRQKIDPDTVVPLTIRVKPSKLDDYGDWEGVIDVAWVVYKPTRNLGPAAVLDKEWQIAQRYGWKMIAGVNAEDCRGTGTNPCTGDELRQYVEPILRHPGVCLSSSWKYADATWSKSSIRDAWTYLAGVAATLTGDCR
jgi:hypothetical protein